MSKKTRITIAIIAAALAHLATMTVPIVANYVNLESVWNGGLIALYIIVIYSCLFFFLYHMIRSGVLPKWLRIIFTFFATLIILAFLVCFAILCFNA